MKEKNNNDDTPILTHDEATTLELLKRGARVFQRPTGWVLHLKGYTYAAGGEKTVNDLIASGFLEGTKVTDAGRETLERYYNKFPSTRWKE